MDIALIALDLDGTQLDRQKRLTPRNRRALERAAAKGIRVVPCTGRFYRGMPAVIRDLPFVRYVITMNGAEVLDVTRDRPLYRAEIAPSEFEPLFDYMDTLPVIYDCYQDGWGWMDRRFYDGLEEFMAGQDELDMATSLRTPVDDFRGTLRRRNMPIQKTQMFFRLDDLERRDRELERIAARFPNLAVSAAIYNNIEINSREAQKGRALRELCAVLGLRPEQAMAFGDGLNDVSMLRDAGVGVAMANASAAVRAAADRVAPSNEEDGVACVIEELLDGCAGAGA